MIIFARKKYMIVFWTETMHNTYREDFDNEEV